MVSVYSISHDTHIDRGCLVFVLSDVRRWLYRSRESVAQVTALLGFIHGYAVGSAVCSHVILLCVYMVRRRAIGGAK